MKLGQNKQLRVLASSQLRAAIWQLVAMQKPENCLQIESEMCELILIKHMRHSHSGERSMQTSQSRRIACQ